MPLQKLSGGGGHFGVSPYRNVGFPEYNLHRALQNSAKSQPKLGLRSTSSNAITLEGIEKIKTEKNNNKTV